jgi:hypothetical protein
MQRQRYKTYKMEEKNDFDLGYDISDMTPNE